MIALNTTWNLVNFRSGLIRALLSHGCEVVAVAPPDGYVPRLLALGCRYEPMPMDNQGTHLGRDLMLLWRFYRLFRRERPAVYLGYTVKPNVYGSLAARALGIPVVNNISGLGAVFIKDTWLTRLVRLLYRIALSRSTRVFFQNADDRRLFVNGHLVRQEVTEMIPGSGLDLTRFKPAPPPETSRGIRFLLMARMLWDKGVGEFVEAARIIKLQSQQGLPVGRNTNVEFCLLGFLDVKNPAAVSSEQVQAWVDEGTVNYLGATDDVRPYIAEADCIVLPSYREGTPRSLLEAAAMARPIITTDAVGCREVVDDEINGFLCLTRDAADLAEKMQRMIAVSPEARAEMGRRGREKVERQFDEKIVINKYLATIEKIIGHSTPAG